MKPTVKESVGRHDGVRLCYLNRKMLLFPIMFLLELYMKKYGFNFDHIYAFEVTEQDPNEFYKELLPKINIMISSCCDDWLVIINKDFISLWLLSNRLSRLIGNWPLMIMTSGSPIYPGDLKPNSDIVAIHLSHNILNTNTISNYNLIISVLP